MIFLLGDFPAWLPIFTLIGGVTTALIIGGIIAGGLAAAGTTAYGIKSGLEGNWPWTDPEAWFTGYAKSLTSPVSEIIADAMGEPSISEQIKDATGQISRGEGSAGTLQTQTGVLPARLSAEAQQARDPQHWEPGSQPQPMGGQAMGGEGGGGANRYDAMDAEEKGPSRSKILGQAAKDIAIGAGTTVASLAIPVAGSFLGPTAGTAGQFANVAAGASSTAAEAAGAAVPSIAAIGAQAAPAAPSFLSTAADALRAVPETIGSTATGVLQRTLVGAGLGAGSAALKGEDPLRAAAMGGAGGVVGGIAGYGAQQFAPPPVPTITANPFPMPEISAPSFVGGTAPAAPTLGSFAASKLPSLLGSGASQGVGYLMTPPQPPQPAQQPYSSRPTYADVYDIGGPNATYGGRRPYWGG
jgi:hypothetical protein